MGTMLDIIGSLIVRGTMVVIMLTVTVQLNNALYFKAASRNIQGDLNGTVEVLDSDFRKGKSILAAYPDSITFMAALAAEDTVAAEVTYFLSDTLALSSTPNPRDRILYRKVSGGAPFIVGTGVTWFYMRYYNAKGVETPDSLDVVESIKIELDIEHSYFTYNDVYPKAHWQRYISRSNL